MLLWTAKQTWVSRNASNKAALLERKKVKNIAVIKHAALGDMLLVRPMLITLRETFPNATLTLSVVTNYRNGTPEDLVDRIHVAKGNERRYSSLEAYKSYKKLGAQDLLFDISATNRSFWLTKLTPATLKIGFIHRGLHKLLYDIAIPRAHYRFEAESFMEQMHVIGVDFEWPLRFDLAKPESIRDKPNILYFATASVASKCWPAENFSKLINNMCQKLPDHEHLLLSGLAEWEQSVATNIASEVKHSNFSLIPGGPDTFTLVANAYILVANDTGIRNMAIAYYTPTVGIFPPSFTAFGYRPLFGPHDSVTATELGPAPVELVEDAILKLHAKLSEMKH